jgi:hypothetical protein
MQDEAKTLVDTLAISGAWASLAGILPSVASILSIIWLSLRIIESETVRGWLGKNNGQK